MANDNNNSGLLAWIDRRFPLTKLWNEHLAHYYAPKNFNFWYFFGSLALLVLVLQILTGIFLTMHYKPDATLAFASVEYIMRDVNWGWLIRYMHSTGASFLFIVVYLHMFRALIYGSFKEPRELLWIVGMFIYLALMAEAFMGYLLPWGQMSYWGAQVIVNLFGAIPFIGEDLAIWIRGDYVVSDATLNRFFAFHVIAFPLILVGLVFIHILALHEVGSNNPDGVEIKKNKNAEGIPLDGIPFHPYYTVKDIYGVAVFLIFFTTVIFYFPEMGGYFLEHNNFIEANPLITPENIAPLWYFTPFYTVLRAIPDPWYGVLAMMASIMVLFFMPWIDRNPIKSIRYRSILHKINIMALVISFFYLGYLGVLSVNLFRTEMGLRFSEIYFLFFFVLWVHSSARSTAFNLGALAAVIGLITLYDVMRGYDEAWDMIIKGWFIPVAYIGFQMLALSFTRMGQDQQEPQRVTM